MIGLGAWSFSEEVSEYGYTRFLRVDSAVHLVLHVSLAMMIVGGITFLMSFAGCLGALRENICLLKLVSTSKYSTIWIFNYMDIQLCNPN